MDVIQYHDPQGQTMVARVPSDGTSDIRLGSQLIVEESQQAVFFRDGKALDTFGPGRHTLATQNVPIVASLFGIPFGGRSPFQAAVVFVSTKTFLDLKWGTKEPVIFRDKELAMVRLRAFGKFAVRVINAQLFVNSVVGTRGAYSTDGVESYFRDAIVARLTDVLGENLTSIFDLPKLYDELAMGLKSRVADDFHKYGIELVDLFLGAITPPEEVQKLIDERSGMGALGDMNAYLKFKTARAIGDAAQQPGGGAGGTVGAGLGIGMGVGLGAMLPGMMREAMQGGGSPPAAAANPQPSSPAAGGPAGGAAGGSGGSGESGAAAAGGAASAAVSGGAAGASPLGGAAGAAGNPAFCFNCGQKLPAGSKFCSSCGTRIGA
ncbi:MAG TPA: SPFH domain-containing protein [Thermoanaerobaculia bacterium]|nr:SPFH domain-containing protein [Thermoanaerobaculia bacterium]